MTSLRRYLVNHLTAALPPTRLYGLKARLWRWARIATASNSRIASGVRIWTSGPVRIGSDTFIGHGVSIIGGDAAVTIGDLCDIGPNVLIVTGSHIDDGGLRAAGEGFSAPIIIEDGVWVGANCTILGGVNIGRGAILAAGSLVNKSIESFTVVAGVPAKRIRRRGIQTVE